jgi:hypothetical protein
MDIVPVPLFTAVVGVNTTVYCVGETTTKELTNPPKTVRSLCTNVDDASDKFTVIVEVCPIFNVELDAVKVADGFT